MKGALEMLFARALLDEGERARLEAFADDWARRGLRVLAVAERWLPESAPLDEAADSELSVLGLAALQDPLRPAAAEAVRTARSAGIGVSMLTGDHPLTAATMVLRSVSATVLRSPGRSWSRWTTARSSVPPPTTWSSLG